MTQQLIQSLRERANLFRAQVQPGSNIFDQAADEIDELQATNIRLQEEITFIRGLLNELGEIEIAPIPEDAVEVSNDPWKLGGAAKAGKSTGGECDGILK